jgi:hypothetical protein
MEDKTGKFPFSLENFDRKHVVEMAELPTLVTVFPRKFSRPAFPGGISTKIHRKKSTMKSVKFLEVKTVKAKNWQFKYSLI